MFFCPTQLPAKVAPKLAARKFPQAVCETDQSEERLRLQRREALDFPGDETKHLLEGIAS